MASQVPTVHRYVYEEQPQVENVLLFLLKWNYGLNGAEQWAPSTIETHCWHVPRGARDNVLPSLPRAAISFLKTPNCEEFEGHLGTQVSGASGASLELLFYLYSE